MAEELHDYSVLSNEAGPCQPTGIISSTAIGPLFWCANHERDCYTYWELWYKWIACHPEWKDDGMGEKRFREAITKAIAECPYL